MSLLKRKLCACRPEKVGSGKERGASVHAFKGCVAHVNKGLPRCVILCDVTMLHVGHVGPKDPRWLCTLPE